MDTRPVNNSTFTPTRVYEFWVAQAKEHGESSTASWSDSQAIELEIKAIAARLSAEMSILDVGCANGFSSLAIAEITGAVVHGIDYVPEMIREAEARLSKVAALRPALGNRLSFSVGDILNLPPATCLYDAVISTRVIINLGNFKNQAAALQQCAGVLRAGGLFLCSEATVQGWQRLNAMRSEWGLDSIPMPPFNYYVDEEPFIEAASQWFELVEICNFASSYFVGTRIIKPLLAAAATAPISVADPGSEWNRWCAALPAAGDYGTQKLFVFKRRAD